MDKPTKTAKRRDRRSFTPEFKAEVVRLCKAGDRSIERVAKDLDLSETALRKWLQKLSDPARHLSRVGGRHGPDAPRSGVLVLQIHRARAVRENKQLLMDREILKKAAKFFAKESP